MGRRIWDAKVIYRETVVGMRAKICCKLISRIVELR
jgi:hypothetical protein